MGQRSAEQEMLDQIREVAFYHWTASRHQAYPPGALQSHELQLPDGPARTCHLTVVRTVFLQNLIRKCLPMRKLRSARHLPSSCLHLDPGLEARTAFTNDWWL